MKILVPIDGSKYALAAVKTASEMAKAMNADVTLMMVTPGINDMDIEYTAKERASLETRFTEYAEKALGDAKAVLAQNGIDAKTSIMSSNSVVDAIISVAKEEKTDVIVIGSRGLGATARIVMGGVSSRVVNHAPCSVLVVRAET